MNYESGGLKDLVSTDCLSSADVEMLLDTAAIYAKEPLRDSKFLANQTVVIYMNKASTRTRLASETAVAHLGGTPIFVRGDELQIGRGETLPDTAKVISGFAKAMIIRTYAQNDIAELAKYSSIPIINALTDDDHPTQLLADWVTIREVFGKDVSGRKFTYVGDGNNMANAWLLMGAILGVHVVAATPTGEWAPDEKIVDRAKKIAALTGGKVEVIHDAKVGATGASVLYTDVWMSMGDSEVIREKKIKDLSPFAITEELMSLTAPDAVFMHCLPAHRGEEVSADVIDGAQSVVFDEAENRLHAQKALLELLMCGNAKISLLND